jgi:hypothetical protein
MAIDKNNPLGLDPASQGSTPNDFEVATSSGTLSGLGEKKNKSIPGSTANKKRSRFDADAAAKAAADSAGNSPGGHCAKAVREALEAGGIKLERVASAKDYGPSLENAGFKPIAVTESTYTPAKGDVVIFQPCKNSHPDGHMQIYDGTQFVSDFKQKDKLWPNSSETSVWKKEKPKFTVFRMPNET